MGRAETTADRIVQMCRFGIFICGVVARICGQEFLSARRRKRDACIDGRITWRNNHGHDQRSISAARKNNSTADDGALEILLAGRHDVQDSGGRNTFGRRCGAEHTRSAGAGEISVVVAEKFC